MVTDLSATTAHLYVWRPDAVESVCFLVSSVLSWYEACHGRAAAGARGRRVEVPAM